MWGTEIDREYQTRNDFNPSISSFQKPALYDYNYAVHDGYHGTSFGHIEDREGYTTKGQYFVALPDGRVQTVTYHADEHGYHPVVTYDNPVHH